MRLLTLALAVTLAQTGAGAAPGYEVAKSTGDHDFMFTFRQTAQLVHGAPKNDVLSAWQKLPFPWTLFGQDVTGYYVSDNGYITFDQAATKSVAANTTLPHASAPKLSIFAFWTDLHLEDHGPWAGQVYAATTGAAPNRAHVIYWLSAMPPGADFSATAFSFAIALYENGSFEMIFTAGRKGTAVKATIGATGVDAQTAVMAEGPAFDYPPVGFGGDDDLSYRFTPKSGGRAGSNSDAPGSSRKAPADR
jgi:hypothetical protein